MVFKDRKNLGAHFLSTLKSMCETKTDGHDLESNEPNGPICTFGISCLVKLPHQLDIRVYANAYAVNEHNWKMRKGRMWPVIV